VPPDDPQYGDNLQLVRDRVRGFLLARHHSPADADDVAQDCVAILLDRYPNVRERIDLLKLATRIASNRICQLYRDRARLAELPDAQPASNRSSNPEDLAGHRELVDRILFGMMELQSRCRDLLRMLLIEQKDYSEIRAMLGVESDYIYVLRERCLQALRRNVGGTFYGTG
jgi:RNA polymerase sigma factor (sigma-70 family)